MSSSRRSVLDESPAYDPSLHRPMMPAGRSGSLTFVNLSSASSLFSNPSPPVSGGGPPLSGGGMTAPMSGGGGAVMAPMSGGSSIGGMPPLMPNVVSPAAGHHPHHHHHQAQAAYPQQASPMGSWGFPTNAATSLQAPLQPAVLHQPHQPHTHHQQHQQGMPMPMQPQPVYQPQQQHPSMQPQAPFSLGGPPGSQGPYGHLPSPLQPTPVGGHPAAGWNATAAQHQQHLAYGGGSGGLNYASPPTSRGSGGSPSHSSYSSPPSSTSSSSTSSPSPSSTSSMMAGVGFGYGGVGVGVGVGVGGAGGGNGSFRLDEAQERMRQQHEQIRAEERLKQQQLHVKMLQEEQQRHLREEQERERIEAEKRKAEREALRQEEERKRLEAQREQERQQEALRAEQMRIFEEVRQAQLRLQHEQELQQQRQQMEQFEQQQKMIQEQQRQQEQLRLERIRFEEEQRREEEAARLQQERVKQEEERKRQDLLRQEQLRQEQFALEQKRREDALQEKRRQEQLLLAQQEKLRREQEEVEQEKLRAEQRLNSERMQQEKERLAEEVRQQQERLRLAQEEIQREKEKMAIELMREQQRIQEERQRLQAEHEKLRQERMERERLEEESRLRHQERVRQHQEQLARQQEAIRQQQQQQVAHLRQQQEQMMRTQAQPQAQAQPQPQPQVSRTQTAPILSRRPTPQMPPVPTNASSWSPFGPQSSAAEERPGEMKPRPRASVGSAILSRPPPHGSGTGSPNKASTLDSPFGGTSAAGGGGGSAIHQRPISPPNAAQQGTRHPRKPRHPGAPAPIGSLPGSQEQQIQADAMASYEAYAAEIARKHRVSDRAEIMTADTMFDSSAFENKLELYEDHNEQRSAYYDDSSDDENGFCSSNRRSETNPPQPRSGSILNVRSPQQQHPPGRTLISHKTGPAATSGSAMPPKRVPQPMVALRTGPAGAPSHREKDAGVVKAKDVPGARPLPCVPGDHHRRRSTGSAEGEDGDDDDNEKNGGNAEKKGGLRALVKHHTGALKRSPRAPIYNDTEQQQPPPPQHHPRSAGFSHLGASVDSAHALIEELQEVTGHKEEGQPRSAPLPRVVRQLPTPSHTSPPPATPPRSASKSLPPVPVKNPPTAAGRQLPPKKAPLPPVPRKALSREEAALIFQTRWRSSRMRRRYTQITLRTRVAREIYSSELVYVQSLGVTIDVFLKPLRRAAEQSKPIILSADIASVFGNLEEIYAYHLQMVSKLESRITRWNIETQIGDTFLDMKQDFIMLYSSYINHYDQALETIGRCKDLKTWRAFIQRCNQHPECGGLSLESFLILPVQRVTRYVILLRDLRQKTPENHVDYQNINAAQTYMDNICYQVNENKRSAENMKKQMDVLASLQAKMKPKDMVRDLVDQNRVFVKQVVVTLYDQDSDKRREVCLFVFNDQLLVTKGDIKKDRFQIIAKFTRDDINFRLEIMADTDDFMGQQIKNAFVLHTPRVSYLFFCISPEERNLLFEQIRSIFR